MSVQVANPALFDDVFRLIKASEETADPDRRGRFREVVASELVSAKRDLIDTIGKGAFLTHGTRWRTIGREWLLLRKQTEHLQRRLAIQNPASAAELEANLRWMAELGEPSDLELLESIRRTPPFVGPEIAELANTAIARVRERAGQTSSRDDVAELVQEAHQAYEHNRVMWEQKYPHHHIAFYAGQIVDADLDKDKLVARLFQTQREHGPFRACIIEVGAPPLTARGPRIKRPATPLPSKR
jgi:hypothetical protein